MERDEPGRDGGAGDEIVVAADPALATAATQGFIGLYWLMWAGFALWSLISERMLLPVVVVAGVALWAWGRSVSSVEPVVTELRIGRDRIVYRQGEQVQEVDRADLGGLQVESRWLGRTVGTWPVLVAESAEGEELLQITLWDRDATVSGLRRQGWPVDER